MPDGFHPPLEEYLHTVLELAEEGTVVIQARLAERLGHSAPSVSEMVKRLRDEGWVEVINRQIRLTSAGRQRAESVVRKHRLAERLLTDVIGLEWHKIHREAGRWEHVISDDVEQKLVALLGNPSTCPHGNPIPGSPAIDRDLRPLSSTTAGDRIRLERVTEQMESDHDSLVWLDSHHFIPGADGTVTKRKADGTVVVELAGGTIAVDAALADQLYVASA